MITNNLNNNISLVAWNIHKMTQNVAAADFVLDYIKKYEAIILTEYTADKRIEDGIKEEYFYDTRIRKGRNGVLVAVKKSIVKPGTEPDFTRFLYLDPDRPDAPATLAVNFRTTNGARLTIIGCRYIQGLENALSVSKWMNTRLRMQKNPWIIAGDFNILQMRMSEHYRDYKGSYSGGFDDCSAIFVDNFENGIITSFQRLDHAVYRGITCNESYCWDFLSEDTDVYPAKADIVPGKVWKIPAGYPDHAMLCVEMEIQKEKEIYER